MRRYNQTQVFQFQTSKLKCLYFFHFVKDQYSLLVKKPEPNAFAWFCILDSVIHGLGKHHQLVEVNGIEPMTSCLQSRRSPN